MDDSSLLKQFVTDRSQPAFAELVRRYVDLVYSAARRQVGDATVAEDVAQGVFVILAEKAPTIREGEALAGWLLVTTRFVALNQVRSDARRRKHEREAAAMKLEMSESEEADWGAIGPMLDEAVEKLRSDDRDALAMRYFQGRSVNEIATTLGISQEAAQKRVWRAVERLRELFAKRGIPASPEGLAGALAANAMIVAPVALGAKIASTALTAKAIAATGASGAGVSGTTAGIGKGTVVLMAAAKAKVVAASVVGTVLMVVTGTIAYQQMSGPANKPRQITVASPPVVTGNDVHARMRSVYALGEGEIVKHVPTPFIADRLNWYEQISPEQAKSMPQGPDVVVFTDDGERLFYRGMMFNGRGGGTVSYAIENVVGIESYNMVLDPRVQGQRLDGDWVIRERTTTAQRADAMSKLLTGVFGQSGRLVQKPMERNVIVVDGTFAYNPLPESKAIREFPGPNPILFYHGKFDRNAQRSAGTMSISEILTDQIGESMGMPVVIDAKLNNRDQYGFRNSMPWSNGGRTDAQEEADMTEMLLNLTKQTGLTFTRAKRVVPTWVWEKT